MLGSASLQPAAAPPSGLFAGTCLDADTSAPAKNASGKNFCKTRRRRRNFYPQPVTEPQKNTPVYDQHASEPTIYAYTGGNPVNWVDFWGLAVLPPNAMGPLQPGDTWAYPPEIISGGPWTWYPDTQNPRGGEFKGPLQQGKREVCTYAPEGSVNNNKSPYWKKTDLNGNKEWYSANGEPTTPGEVHPGPDYNPYSWASGKIISKVTGTLGTIIILVVGNSTPAY